MDDQRTANVQLTADVQQYSQGIQQANKDTNALLASVNKLSASLDGITKRVGKRLMLFSAADVATISAAVLVTSKYESQLKTLRAQTVDNKRVMDQFAAGIKDVSKQIPVSRGEIAALTTQIAQLGLTSGTEIPKVAMVFEKMAAATGEGVGDLTSGLIELSRMMGTLGNGAAGLEAFSDSVVALSNQLGVSSTAILSFAQNIAPIGDVAGVTQKQILGLSAAFVKAGADGIAGANAFNSILTDITNLTLTGSPGLLKYANAANMTLDAFKNLSPLQQFVSIMEATSKQGQRGIQMLDALGINGIRTVKAVAAVTREYGSLEKALNISEGAYNSGLTDRAANAAWNDMETSLKRTQQTMANMADAMGTMVYPIAKSVLDVFNQMLSVVSQLAEPLLKVAGVVAGIGAAFTGVIGAMLTAMGPLSTLMIAMTLFRLSPLRGALGGIRDGVNTARVAAGQAPAMPLSAAGRANAEGRLQPYQAAPYRWAERAGRWLGTNTPPGAATAFRTAGYGSLRLVQGFADSQRQWIANAGNRDPFSRVSMFSRSFDNASTNAPTGAAGMRTAASGLWTAARMDPRGFLGGLFGRGPDTGGQNATQLTQNMAKTTAAYASHAAAVAAARGTTASLAAAAGGAARSLALIPVAYARMGASLAMQGLGSIAAAPFRMIGGMFGGGGLMGAGIAAVGASAYMAKKSGDSYASNYEFNKNITDYNVKLGKETAKLEAFYDAGQTAKDVSKDFKSNADAFNYALKVATSGLKYTNEAIKNIPKTVDGMVNYLKSLGPLSPDQALLAAQDVRMALGNDAAYKQTMTEYGKQTAGGTQWATEGQNMSSNYNYALDKSRGWLQGYFSMSTSEANDTISQGIAQIFDEASTYGTQTVDRKKFADLNVANQNLTTKWDQGSFKTADIVAASRATSAYDELAASSDSAGARGQFVEALARQFGMELSDIGFDGTTDWKWRDLSSMQDVKSAVAETDTPEARRFLDIMNNALGVGQLPRFITGIQEDTSASDASRTGLERTALGRFALSNKNYIAAAKTTGSETEDPVVIFNTVRDISKQLEKTTGNLADAVRQTTEAKNQFAPEERGFQIFDAAQQYMMQRSLANTQATQGAMAARRSEYSALDVAVETGTTADPTAANQRMFELNQQTRADAGEYMAFVRNFYRQLQYATQDHARQMKYMAEDAAKAMFNPYERMAAQATTSVETMMANTREQAAWAREGRQAVDQMKSMGVSQQFIDMNDLANPANAQQAQRTLMDFSSNKGLIKSANKTAEFAGDQAKKTTQDTDNVNFRRSEDTYNISRDRNMKQLERYGEEVLGSTKKVLADTQGYLEKMGLKTTTYFKNLKETADDIFKNNKNKGKPAPKPGDKGFVGPVYDPDYIPPKIVIPPMSVPKNRPKNSVPTGDPISAVTEMGSAAYEGFIVGWNDPENVGMLNQAVYGLLGGVKSMLGISSPSKEFMKIGRDSVAGFRIGVENNIDTVWGAFQPPKSVKIPHGAIAVDTVKGVNTAGRGSKPSSPAYAGGSVTYNNGTYITGPITVKAQDPNEMARKMQERSRQENLSKGANASY